MRRFFSGNKSVEIGGEIVLGTDETRHLRDVLRLRTGDEIAVFDGSGSDFVCRIESIGKRESALAVLSRTEAPSPESPLNLTLAVALLKSDKFDLVIQKCVELGVAAVIPILTARCDVKLKDASSRVERWRKIVIEASKQCGRASLMRIDEPEPFGAFARTQKGSPSVFLFSERGGEPFDSIEPSASMTAVVGPEGGWDDAELSAARDAGFRLVTFGGRILRAETASIAVASILQHRFGDLN